VHGSKQNIRELRLAFPTPPTAILRRIVGSGDVWVIKMLFDYDGDRYNTIVVHEHRDGLVVHETAYYGAPVRGTCLASQVGRINSNLGDELTATSIPASRASSNAPTAAAAD
jgi:hypothetical protein